MFGSRGESGGEAEVGRIGLDDRGEGFVGRYGLDAVKVWGSVVLGSSRKIGRGIVLNMVVSRRTRSRPSVLVDDVEWKVESGCYDILAERRVG